MPIDTINTVTTVSATEIVAIISGGITAMFGVGMGVRKVITSFKNQGLIDAGITSHQEALKNSQTEAKKWQELHEAERAGHEHTKRMIVVIQMQNVMLKMMLRERGVSLDDIDEMERKFAPDGETHGH